MSLRLIYLNVFLFYLFCINIPVLAQQILDEMQLIDISEEQAIRATVIRDPAQALLIVKTQISTMRIQSNNIIKKAEQIEPGTWHIRLVPGTHRLSFQADGFISVQERFYFNPKDVKGIRIRVVPAAEKRDEKNTGIIVIKSTPDSAAVYLNGQFYGTTPYLGKTLAGQYKLELKKEPYLSHEQLIIIISGETLPVNVELSKDAGSIQISSTPSNARIELNNRYIGNTPLTYTKVPKGKHKIQVILENYETFEAEFEIDKDHRFHEYNIPFKPKESILNIMGFPNRAQVKINEKERGVLPLNNYKISYGSHLVSVTQPGYYEFQKNILISSNDPYELHVSLDPKSKYSALLYSALLPGSGQIHSDRTTTGIILGASTLGIATAALLFTNNYNTKNDEYKKAKAVYNNNNDLDQMDELFKETQDKYGEMEDAHQLAQISWGITIAAWLYNMADAFFFFPEQSGLNVKTETHSSYSRLVLCLHF